MSQSLVGAETASAPSASAPTCTTATMAKGTNPIQSRFMALLVERAAPSSSHARTGRSEPGGVSGALLGGEVERDDRDDRAWGVATSRKPAFSNVDTVPRKSSLADFFAPVAGSMG